MTVRLLVHLAAACSGAIRPAARLLADSHATVQPSHPDFPTSR